MITDENVISAAEKFRFKDLNSNFAFSLWSNKFEPIDPRDVLDYVKFEATMLETSYDLKTGQTWTSVPLDTHICNDDDIFFKPLDH